MAAARVWVDHRDGRGWIVEKRRETLDWGNPVTDPTHVIETPFLRFCRPREDYLVELAPDTPLEAFTPDQLLGLFDMARSGGRLPT